MAKTDPQAEKVVSLYPYSAVNAPAAITEPKEIPSGDASGAIAASYPLHVELISSFRKSSLGKQRVEPHFANFRSYIYPRALYYKFALPGARAESKAEKETNDMPTSDQLTDEKLKVLKAETDTKFAELIGKMDTQRAEINGALNVMTSELSAIHRQTSGIKLTIVTTVIPTAIALLGALVAILGYGQNWFGLGMTTNQIVQQTVHEMQQQQQAPTKPTP